MGDRQWPDPRGWEALTQAEAEKDARAETLARALAKMRNRMLAPPWGAQLDRAETAALLDALAVAERERDEVREALRRIADGDHIQPTLRCDIRGCDCAQVIARAALDGGPQT